ncbi:META domain-containing protein [Pseudoduganella sp. UC29_71]|jgi:heat shock protein HslJ|uniref:META domain-containing protein n=1 Tax=Pseudoduganella sp. UC29_71 TaxID=3350174 RepID=UPI00366BA903
MQTLGKWMTAATMGGMLALAAGCSTTGASGSAPSASLTDTSWQLAELGGQPAGKQSLKFDSSKGIVSGSGGCNNFTGAYQWSGKSLKMGPLASTRRACMDDASGKQENAYLQALDATRTWKVEGKTLILSGDSGQLARFTAQ